MSDLQVKRSNTRPGASRHGLFTAALRQFAWGATLLLLQGATWAAAPVGTTQAPAGDWLQGSQEAVRWGGRIGHVDEAGVLRVQLRDQAGAEWLEIARDVADFQLLDWRLAVLKRDGTLWLGEGPLTARLEQIDQGVAAFQLTLTRVGILRGDGTFRVKEWGFAAATIATGVQAFQVLNDRVGVLGADGTFWMQYGGTVQGFVQIAKGVEHFQLEREWVAYQKSGRLHVARTTPYDYRPKLSDLQFREVSADADSFQMEVTVDISDSFDSRMHLAVIDWRGQVSLGEAVVPEGLVLASAGLGPAVRVQWAARQLAALGADGLLQLAQLDDSGKLVNAQDVESVKDFQLAPEGNLLLSRHRTGTLSLIGPQVQDAHGRWQVASNKAAQSTMAPGMLGAAGRSFDLAGEEILRAGSEKQGSGAAETFDMSSLRPAFTRQPVALPGSAREKVAVEVKFADASDLDYASAKHPVQAEAEVMPQSGTEGTAVAGLKLASGTVLRHRKYDSFGKDHATAFTLNEGDTAGYLWEASALFYLTSASAPAASQAVYRCRSGINHFDSLDSNCEGKVKDGTLGYLLKSARADHIALYRCRAGTDHFISDSSTCEGQIKESTLGYSPTAPKLALRYRRYSQQIPNHLMALTGSEGQTASVNYRTEAAALFYTTAATGSQLVYRCQNGNDTFESLDSNCEGKVKKGTLGYLLTSARSDHIALYRCRTGADHFVSDSSSCEGQIKEGVLGYSPGRFTYALGTSTATFDIRYINDYQYAAGGYWNGHFFPNLIDNGVTWYGYVSANTNCWETGYAKRVTSGANQPGCFAGPAGFYYLRIDGRLSRSSSPWTAVPGEITANQFGLVPLESSINRTFALNGLQYHSGWERLLPTAADLQRTNGSTFFTNVPAATGLGPQPNCGGTCITAAPRAVIDMLPSGVTRVYISGVGTSGNIFQDAKDVVTGINNLNGNSLSRSPTYNAILQELWDNNRDLSRVVVSAHSLGNFEAIALGNSGWAREVYGFSPPSILSSSSMFDKPYVNFTFFSGNSDFISNGVFMGTNASRISSGVDLFTGNTGGFNLFNLFENHGRGNYWTTFPSAPTWTRF